MMMKTLVLFFLGVSAASAIPIDSNINSRVVGGSAAAVGQFPFIISLRIDQNFLTCGGSLIAPDWVLTAAHCVYQRNPSSFTVVAGTNQLDSDGVFIAVEKLIVHPEYNPTWTSNDVALIKLVSPVKLSPLIKTIALGCDHIDVVQNCTLVGWGKTGNPGYISNDLQFVNLLTVPHDECKAKWLTGNPVFTSEICTLTEAGEGACNGDSGGPLVTIQNGKTSLIGAVSWGAPCARGKPDVYSRVASFCGWIKEHIQN